MNYFGWQINDMKKPMAESVRAALDRYIEKHGLPEQILLETGLKDVPAFPDLPVVVRSINIPPNILLIGRLP